MINIPEGYLPIVDCPQWYINEYGEIWSGISKRKISQHDNGKGYMQVVYQRRAEKIKKKHYIHILVAKTFLGEIPCGLVINHKDGVKTNNHISNLEFVTSQENNLHAVETGLRKKWRGEVHPQSKITENDVFEIRRLLKLGKSNDCISKLFNVTAQTISDIKKGKSWSWLV